MNLSEFVVRHGFHQGKLYRHLRKFSEETIKSTKNDEEVAEDNDVIERDLVDWGFRFAFDKSRGRVTYEIYDEAKFKPLALQLMRYAVLSEKKLAPASAHGTAMRRRGPRSGTPRAPLRDFRPRAPDVVRAKGGGLGQG